MQGVPKLAFNLVVAASTTKSKIIFSYEHGSKNAS